MSIFTSRRRLCLVGVDFLIVFCTYLAIVALNTMLKGYSLTVPAYALDFSFSVAIIFVSRIFFRTYENVWRYANSTNYLKVVAADAVSGAVLVLVSLFSSSQGYSLHVWQEIALVAIADIATLVSRFAYQMLYKHIKLADHESDKEKIGVAIVGAGQIGHLLADELRYSASSKYKPLFFIDTDKNKIGSKVADLNVFDENADIEDKIKSFGVKEVLLALPAMDGESTNRILKLYTSMGCKVKIYDTPMRSPAHNSSKRVIRDVSIDDILFRNSQNILNEQTKDFYRGKVVLVTGGGGSIGSELCRQIAACAPKKLIVFDIYENNAYDIQQQLVRKYGNTLDLEVEIGSVRDRARLSAVFASYRPNIVLHAAAHKHVPLMEHSGCEAIKNNVLGTYNTADMAEKYGVEKFILISTDKAVNPTNIMGASKRLCEMVVQCRTDSATKFAAVRFGNVLGSNGSVIPLFKRQIEEGGPLTITDKRIIRYFMTIPEASALVMQAGAMAGDGDLFVLDMGNPVKILDLAENMIKLSGLTPYVDIDIVEIGLRPGEKLYEELLIKTEKLTKTENNMIFIERDAPLTREAVEEKLTVLKEAIIAAEDEIGSDTVRAAMKSVVPTFYDPEEINSRAEHCEEMKLVRS